MIWAWRTRWRWYVGVLAIVAVVALVVVLVTRGGGGTSELVVQDDPTSMTTAQPTLDPTPQASTGTPSSAPAVEGEVSAAPTPEPEPTLDAAHLLSNDYVSTAFATGRRPEVHDTGQSEETLIPCPGYAPGIRGEAVARAWSWPDEIVVLEELIRFDSPELAGKDLARCHKDALSPFRAGAPSDRTLDVGAGGYLVRWDDDLFDEVTAGARVDDTVVLVSWRQSGQLGNDEPLVAALRAAVAKAFGSTEPSPVAAAAQHTPAELRGFLRHETLPASVEARGAVAWARDTKGTAALDCQQTTIPTAGPTIGRAWVGGVGNGGDFLGVIETVGRAEDETQAQHDFQACRDSYSLDPSSDLAGIGDQAFLVDLSGDEEHQVLYVRAGSTYVLITCQQEDPLPVARAAVDALRAAGRIS